MSASLGAADDFTGKWSGKNTFVQAGAKQENAAYAILKQEGTSLTGTIGPDATHQWPISNAKFEATKDGQTLLFTLEHTSTGSDPISFTATYNLRLVNAHLVGHAKMMADGTTSDFEIDLQRVK